LFFDKVSRIAEKYNMKILQEIGQKLAHYLAEPRKNAAQIATSSPEKLAQSLRPGDVLLVEGSSRFSTAVKYLTQSSWSHAALFIGDVLPSVKKDTKQPTLVEADINTGVHTVGLSLYTPFHTRICRPVGLNKDEIDKVINYILDRIGDTYDLRNIIDLARYLFPMVPIPGRFRRRLLSLGNTDTTQAICSSLIAQAFQSIKYPILPEIVVQESDDLSCINCYKEMHHIRHYSLFTPRDFDVSPYFQIIKPTLRDNFDPHSLDWSEDPPNHPDTNSTGKSISHSSSWLERPKA